MTVRQFTRRSDSGQITVLLLPLLAALIAVAGLVIDGGTALAARQQAANLAEQAARIGADHIDQRSLYGTGPVQVDPAAARSAAESYLRAQRVSGRIETDGDRVTVTVTIDRRTALLGLVGIDSLSVTAHATARSIGGIGRVEEP
jgi:Flp pilus assembly protein TadG